MEEREIIGWISKQGLPKRIYEAILAIIGSGQRLSEVYEFKIKSQAHKEIEAAGVLELWFDPVYREEPKFKVGDWVAARHNGVKELYVGKVSKNGPHIRLNPYYLTGPDNEGLFNEGLFHEIVRLATPEEIEAARAKELKMLVTVKLNRAAHIKFATQELDGMKTAREWFQCLRPDLRDRAIKRTVLEDKKYSTSEINVKRATFTSALLYSFGWNGEGEPELWEKVYREAQDIEEGRKPDIK